VGYMGRIKGETSKFWGGFILTKLCQNNDWSKLGKIHGKTKKKTVEKPVKILFKNCQNFDKTL
jgi:hypothetical protein